MPGPRRRAAVVFDFILNGLAAVAAVLLVTMMLITVLRVVLRAGFNIGLLGVDQIAGILMVYVTFLGAGWVLRKDGHVAVDLVLVHLPPPVRRTIEIIGSLVASAACLVIAYYAVFAVKLSLERGILVAAEFEIPRAVYLVVIPVGCALLGIQFLRRAVRLYRRDFEARDVPRMEA